MDIEQIDLSADFAELQDAEGEEKHKICNRIADKIEYVFSILNYEDSLYSDETRKEQIYGKRLVDLKKVAPKEEKKEIVKHADDDLKQTASIIVEHLESIDARKNEKILPIIEKVFGENKLADPILQKFSFDGEIKLFSENTRAKLGEFGVSLSEYGNSIINKQHEYSEPEVTLYEEGVFEKGDDANRVITEFLIWRKDNKPETLFTFYQENELWNWGHISSFHKSQFHKSNINRDSRNWVELIFASDLSRYEYRGLSASWYEDGHSFRYIIETFWSAEKLHFSFDNKFLTVSDKNKRQLKIRLSTFFNLFFVCPGVDLWGGSSFSFFQDLLESDAKDNVASNFKTFSLSLETHFKSHSVPPKIDLISCWESLGSITSLNHENGLSSLDFSRQYEEDESFFSTLISDLNDNIPILIPYYILGEFFKSDYYIGDLEYSQFKKGFLFEAFDEDFSANKFILERLKIFKTLKAIEFDLLSEAILILTVTDLLILEETEVLNWKYIFDLLEAKNVSRSTKELIVQLFNEQPQKPSENLRKFRSQFKAELDEADPNFRLVKDCLRKGETKFVEFKQTLSWDQKTKTKEKRIEETAMKAICGFLNAEGGTLLIGVDDDAKPVGIDLEIKKFHKNDDRLMLHFKNLLKNHLGDAALSLVERSIVKYQGCKILVVSCPKSQQEIWMDGIKFFVRSHPATDELKGPELLNYIKRRFPS